MYPGKRTALFLAILSITTLNAHPPIQTWLTTPWKSPPMLSQIAEFIHHDKSTAFFPFLSLLSESTIFKSNRIPTDEAAYKSVLDLLLQHQQALLSGPMAIPLLKMSLSLHEFAPAVQAHFQFYESTVVEEIASSNTSFNDCGNWVDWYGIQYCDSQAWMSDVSGLPHQEPRKLLPIDHIYTAVGKHGEKVPTAILYADLTSKDFMTWHSLLMQKADAGMITYVLRYRPPSVDRRPDTLYVSGYGVELAIKSTEYLVTDDRKIDPGHDQIVLSADDGIKKAAAADTTDILSNAEPVIQVLNTEEISDLSVKTAQYILAASDPFGTLQQLSQDFPRFAHLIAAITLQPLYENLATRIPQPQEDGIVILDAEQQSSSKLYLNGLEIDAETINVFKLLRLLKSEHKVVSSLVSLGFAPETAIELLSSIGGSETADEKMLGQMFDTRSDAVFWWNDLENDKRYQYRFGNSIQDLLRPSFPGQMKFIRKNLVSTIYAVNLAAPEQAKLVLESLSFIDRDIPIRMGLVPLIDASDEASSLIAEMILYTLHHKGRRDGRGFLQSLLLELLRKSQPEELLNDLKNVWTSKYADISLETIKNDELVMKQMALIREFMSRLGLTAKLGAVIVNGVLLDADETYTQRMVRTYFQHINYMIGQLLNLELGDNDNVYDYMMNLPHVLPRRNQYIFTSDSSPLKMVDVLQADDLGVVDELKYLSSPYSKEVAPVSIWVVGDLTTTFGAQLALNAIKSLKSADGMRVSFLHNPSLNDTVATLEKAMIPTILSLQDDSISSNDIESYLSAIVKGNKPSLSVTPKGHDETVTMKISSFVIDGLAIPSGPMMIIANGRVIGPLSEASVLTESDFQLLVNVERKERAGSLWTKIRSSHASSKWPESRSADIMLKVASVVMASNTAITASGTYTSDKGRVPKWTSLMKDNAHPELSFTNGVNPSEAFFRLVVTVDPASHTAQKISSIINFSVENASFKIL
ncbi:hypothetical protein SeLEV6574_g08187 [Synchytrium endobioticum]|uniref:Uncharacterized protein n=1 Tax=Synchytrium endobioticum TaxID=286115 RepID=A0A507C8D8_9FUNG|nr:hypothetical protein SeLEV6574_g08187 [Synchytrium endobioticum]